jgi:3-polyprenyl-4-hydroxybenzoate decarboxylase
MAIKKKPGGGYDPREVKTVRDWIELLKSEGEYREVHAKVDWDCEIGTIARYCMASKNGPTLLFDNIKDHESTWCRKLFTNSVGSYGRIALAYGLPKNADLKDLVVAVREAYKRSIPPKEVSGTTLTFMTFLSRNGTCGTVDGLSTPLPPTSLRIQTQAGTTWGCTEAK